MNKNFFLSIALLCTFAVTAMADGQITILSNQSRMNLRQYGLQVSFFNNEQILDLRRNRIPIAEAIDRSQMVILGDQTPANVLKKLFDDTSINAAIDGLLRRGGIVYFAPSSWTTQRSLPESLQKFFIAHKLIKFGVDNYKAIRENGKVKALTGTPNPQFKGELLRKPNDFFAAAGNNKDFEIKGNVYFGNLPDGKFDILFYYQSEKYPLVISSRKLDGGGRIIFSHSPSIVKQASNTFIANMVNYAYGSANKLTEKEQFKARLNKLSQTSGKQAEVKKIDVPIAVLTNKASESEPFRNAAEVTLGHLIGKGELQKNTWVKIDSDANNLFVRFECEEPNIDKLTAQATTRDSAVWNDDCVELFLSSLDGRHDKYHIIVNSIGTIYDANDGNSQWNGNFKITARRWPKSWTVEMIIPFSELGFADPSAFKANFCREEKEFKQLSCWSKTQTFNSPANFGYISRVNKADLSAKVSKLAGNNSTGGTIIIRSAELWQKFYSDSFPQTSDSDASQSVTVARNEKESVAFSVTNTYDQNLYFRLEPEFYIPGTEKRFDATFTLKQAIPWREGQGDTFATQLVKLDEGNVFVLPGLSSRMLWIDIKTQLPPGNYSWKLSLVPINKVIPPRNIRINVKVLPFTFPARLPVNIYTFGPYGRSWVRRVLIRKYWESCKDYHINWIQVQDSQLPFGAVKRSPSGEIVISTDAKDYASDGLDIQKLDLNCVYGYNVYAGFFEHLNKLGYTKPSQDSEAQALFRKWFTQWIGYLKSNNLDFDRAMFSLRDEPGTEVIDELVKAGKFVHEVDPAIKIPSTLAGNSDLNDLKKMNQIVDVWIPYLPKLTFYKNSKESLAFIKSTKKPFWPYLCNTGNDNSLLSYYRLRGIGAYLLGTNGFGVWAYNSWRGNDWQAEPEKTNGSWLFQHGDNGPIPTIRAEAFREAAEDLYLLRLAHQLVAANKGSAKLKKLISREYLTGLQKKVNSQILGKWREELITAISEAKK